MDEQACSNEMEADRIGSQKYFRQLEKAIERQPLNRELLYKVLCFCDEEKPLDAIEAMIAACPEYRQCTQPPFGLIAILDAEGGLQKVERNISGDSIAASDIEGLTEDEVDDLVAQIGYETTPIGASYVDRNKPSARFAALLDLAPERADVYNGLLSYILDSSRSYAEIAEYLSGSPLLRTNINGESVVVQPSVFVDKLERAGMLVWDDGWRLSEQGMRVALESAHGSESSLKMRI